MSNSCHLSVILCLIPVICLLFYVSFLSHPCDLCDASCNTRGDTEKLLIAQVWSIEDLASQPPRWLEREISEAMEQPSLNKDGGRYNLPSIPVIKLLTSPGAFLLNYFFHFKN